MENACLCRWSFFLSSKECWREKRDTKQMQFSFKRLTVQAKKENLKTVIQKGKSNVQKSLIPWKKNIYFDFFMIWEWKKIEKKKKKKISALCLLGLIPKWDWLYLTTYRLEFEAARQKTRKWNLIYIAISFQFLFQHGSVYLFYEI